MTSWSKNSVPKALVAAGAAAAVAALSLWLLRSRRRALKGHASLGGPSLADEIREALEREAAEADGQGSVEEEFQAATAWVSANGSGLSNETKLRLYGCFKQASAGDCQGSQPWGIEASMKWEAWNALRGSSKNFAMYRYVATLDGVAPSWRSGGGAEDVAEDEDKDGSGGMSMGPSVSTMGCIGDASQAADVDETPVGQLCEKIAEGDVEGARALLRKSPELAVQADKERMTPLHWAADRGELEMVRILLAVSGVRAHVSDQDATGDTPLHYAILTENEEVAQLLVSSGANLNVANEAGETPAQLAADAGLDLKQ